MNEAEIAPDPHLMESMRAVGYTLDTAVADVVDNSITAGARSVEILFSAHPEPHVAILDDGSGMDFVGLTEAMRLAGRSPLEARRDGDLGRFGLGLKTASLSQCRTLTVVSKSKGGTVLGVRWSLDHLLKSGRWALLILDEDEIRALPYAGRLGALESGTLVLWTDLDQIHALPEQLERQLDEDMTRVRDHLALVFHRFTGQTGGRFTIGLNGTLIPSVDPFLTTHNATQAAPPEQLNIAGEPVRVQAFTLPYISKLSQKERETAQLAGNLRDSQGFYIYRSKRLVIWGTWFRIVPKDDLGKLARVRVDIPNSLDHLWSLDIKKSTAVPPPEVRTQLRRLAGRFVNPSTRTLKFRGRPVPAEDQVTRIWRLIEDRGTFRYELDREHPILAALEQVVPESALRAVSAALQTIERTFPVEDAYNRLGSDQPLTPPSVESPELAELARVMWSSLNSDGHTDLAEFASRVSHIEPFSSLPDIEKYLRKVIHD